jgi:uncharacterized membrane protein
MQTTTMIKHIPAASPGSSLKSSRVVSIDFLRGVVMIIMALDHVRDYFHRDAFLYSPTDLTQTNGILFFTRFITHYCAPVFVFLAGISAFLYGSKKTKRELSRYLVTRGIWLVLIELIVISLAQTFNPTYPMFNLQVIWAIGISMIVLSGLIHLNRIWILAIALLLIAGHNLLDQVHFTGNGSWAFVWALLHEPNVFVFGNIKVLVHYPLLPWIGVMALGYYFGELYRKNYDTEKRSRVLLFTGVSCIVLFVFLRFLNSYGDVSHWTFQKNVFFSLLSFLNVTKYPPSLLYVLITLGPGMIFLAFAEKPLILIQEKISVFGKVPFFYYVLHIFLIHFLAVAGAVLSGYRWSDMILKTRVNSTAELKGYGFNLMTVYVLWFAVILLLFPLCQWFAAYKTKYQSTKWWLPYL